MITEASGTAITSNSPLVPVFPQDVGRRRVETDRRRLGNPGEHFLTCRPIRRPPDSTRDVIRHGHAGVRRPHLQAGMQAVRNVSDPEHPGHADMMISCFVHFNLFPAPGRIVDGHISACHQERDGHRDGMVPAGARGMRSGDCRR